MNLNLVKVNYLLKLLNRNLFLVFLIALIIQCTFVIATRSDLSFNLPLVDSANYHDIATNTSSTAGKPYWQPPLYVWLLRSIYFLVPSDNMIAVRITHGTIGAIAATLTGFLAYKIFSFSPLLPAIILSLYGPFLFYSTQLLPTVTGILLFVISIYFLLLTLHSHSLKHSFLCGLSTGLSSLTIANFLVFLPIAVASIFSNNSVTSRKQKSYITFTFLAGIALCILPVTMRNYIASKTWVPISTNAGINLFIGNNPDFENTIIIRPGIDWLNLLNKPFRENVRTPEDADRWFIWQVIKFAKTNPAKFTYNMLQKTLLFLNGYEMPRNTSIYSYRPKSKLLSVLVWKVGSFFFPFSILFPFFLLGFITNAWRSMESKILAVFIVIYSLSVILFFPSDRYRLPVIPFMIIFAIQGIQWLINSRHNKRKISIIIFLFMAGLSIASLPINYPTEKIPFNAELDFQTGCALLKRHKTRKAFSYFYSALDKNPNLADAWYYYGVGLLACEEFTEAAEKFQTCLTCKPDHYMALHDLAFLIAMKGNLQESALLFEKTLEIKPDYTSAMKNLGIIRLKQGRIKEANYLLKKAGTIPSNMEIIIRSDKNGRLQPFLLPVNHN